MKHLGIRLALATLTLAGVPAIASDAPVAVHTEGLTRRVAKKEFKHATRTR